MKTIKRCPAHPGRILKNLYLKPLKITNAELSDILGISPKDVSEIVNEKKTLTSDMAIRLSHVFPNSTPASWLALQKNYDLWQVLNNSDGWQSVQPVSNMESHLEI
jgi:antitoxin HigA-1